MKRVSRKIARRDAAKALLRIARSLSAGIPWKKYKAPSGEMWDKSPVFERQLWWALTLDRNYKNLAKILGVPEELTMADELYITIQAKRNLENPSSVLQQMK